VFIHDAISQQNGFNQEDMLRTECAPHDPLCSKPVRFISGDQSPETCSFGGTESQIPFAIQSI